MARLLSVLLVVGLFCAPVPARSGSENLVSDPRLAVRVTANEPVISVRRLLARVQADCGVPLEAAPEVREETVCLGVKEQPWGTVLDELARTLEYRWASSPAGSGKRAWRLVEDQTVRMRRLSQARRYRREMGGELMTQWGLLDRFMRELAGARQEEVRVELQRLEARVRELPTGPERLQVELEHTAAEQSVEPEFRPLLLALAALPRAARERLMDGERMVMASGRAGAIPMPAEVLQALRAVRPTPNGQGPSAGGSPFAGRTDGEFIDFLSQVAWGDLTLYARSRWVPGQQRRLSFAIPTFVQTPSMVAHGSSRPDLLPGKVVADRPEDLRLPVRFTWTPKKLHRDQPLTYFSGVTAAEVLSRLASREPRWQVAGSALLEGIPPRPAGAAPGSGQPETGETAGALLSRLGEKGRTGSLPLGELLEALAARSGVDIQVSRGGWIRFRSTRPFRARQRQVDPEALREAFGPVVDAPALTPETAMVAGRLLSRTQMETLSASNLDFPRHLTQNSGLRSVLDAWRLLDRLPALDRQALLIGSRLRYARLNERSRTAVREYVAGVSASPNGAPLDLELGPRELSALELALTPVSGMIRILEWRLGRLEPPLYTVRLEADWSRRPE